MNVLLYQKGYFPGLSACLKSLRIYSPGSPVFLVGSDIPDQDYIDEKPYAAKATELEQTYRHFSPNVADFEKRCLRRWIILAEFARTRQMDSYFTCDTDVLVMENLDRAAELFKPADFTLPLTAMFVYRPERIAEFGDYILDYYRHPEGTPRAEWERQYRAGQIPSVCDMRLFADFARHCRAAAAAKAACYDVCIEHNLGSADGFHTRDGYKVIQFLFGQPYGITQDGKVIRFLNLHCSGKIKNWMEQYLEQALNTKA